MLNLILNEKHFNLIFQFLYSFKRLVKSPEQMHFSRTFRGHVELVRGTRFTPYKMNFFNRIKNFKVPNKIKPKYFFVVFSLQ